MPVNYDEQLPEGNVLLVERQLDIRRMSFQSVDEIFDNQPHAGQVFWLDSIFTCKWKVTNDTTNNDDNDVIDKNTVITINNY